MGGFCQGKASYLSLPSIRYIPIYLGYLQMAKNSDSYSDSGSFLANRIHTPAAYIHTYIHHARTEPYRIESYRISFLRGYVWKKGVYETIPQSTDRLP